IVAFAELEPFLSLPVKHYSSGMYVRLGFSLAVHLEPDVLAIDEVLSVGDLNFQRKSYERIMEFKRRNKAILLVTHNLDQAELVCDEIVWLRDGAVVRRGAAGPVSVAYEREALKEYFDRSPVPYDEAQIVAGISSRFGSGEILFENVRLLDHNGLEAHTFAADKSMTIELHYHAPRRVQNPDFFVGIAREDGYPLTLINSARVGFCPDALEGRGVVRAEFKPLRLTPGRYYVSVAVTPKGKPLEPYDMQIQRYCVTVYETTPSVFLKAIQLPCRFEFLQAPPGGTLTASPGAN
ncbi:MAG: Wzt carbohydrate-binding domain-containing protein, partial [bacterium]